MRKTILTVLGILMFSICISAIVVLVQINDTFSEHRTDGVTPLDGGGYPNSWAFDKIGWNSSYQGSSSVPIVIVGGDIDTSLTTNNRIQVYDYTDEGSNRYPMYPLSTFMGAQIEAGFPRGATIIVLKVLGRNGSIAISPRFSMSDIGQYIHNNLPSPCVLILPRVNDSRYDMSQLASYAKDSTSVILSAGNVGDNVDSLFQQYFTDPKTLVVGATDESDNIISQSSSGSKVIGSPGNNICSKAPGSGRGDYQLIFGSGATIACVYPAIVASKMLESGLTPQKVKSCILEGLDTPSYSSKSYKGRLNAIKAFACQTQPPPNQQRPIAVINASSTNVTMSTTVSFTSNGSQAYNGATIQSYHWMYVGQNFYTPTFAFTFTQAGSYLVTLQVTDSNGLVSDWAQVTITVTQNNPPSNDTPVVYVPEVRGDAGDTIVITLNVTDPQNQAISWCQVDFGDGQLSGKLSTFTFNHTYVPGTYRAKATCSNALGNEGSMSFNVIIRDKLAVVVSLYDLSTGELIIKMISSAVIQDPNLVLEVIGQNGSLGFMRRKQTPNRTIFKFNGFVSPPPEQVTVKTSRGAFYTFGVDIVDHRVIEMPGQGFNIRHED